MLLTDNFLAGGSADVWVTFNPEAKLKWELRADLGLSVYDTSSFPIGQTEGAVVSDENSFMLRGSALLGMRAEFPNAALGLWLGGGGENEQYDELTVDQALDTHIKDHTDWHLMLTGRLEGGLDYFSLADSAGTVTTTVPIVGVGLRRTEF